MTIMHRSAAPFFLGKEMPPNVAYMSRNDVGDWQQHTWKEIHEKRTRKVLSNLLRKRKGSRRVPCYIWVFCNPFPKHKESIPFFTGWWIYIRTLRNQYGISFRHEYSRPLIERAMSLYPLGIFPSEQFFPVWAEKFAAAYPHIGFHRSRLQGLAPAWCELDEKTDRILDIFPHPTLSQT